MQRFESAAVSDAAFIYYGKKEHFAGTIGGSTVHAIGLKLLALL
jgi:hypothetical protein